MPGPSVSGVRSQVAVKETPLLPCGGALCGRGYIPQALRPVSVSQGFPTFWREAKAWQNTALVPDLTQIWSLATPDIL